MSEHRDWHRYFVTRDSENGVIAEDVTVWWLKPRREKEPDCCTWVASNSKEPGWYGSYSLDEARKLFGTVPDTDLELIQCDQWAPEKSQAKTPKKKMDHFK